MIADQGPQALALLTKLTGLELAGMKYDAVKDAAFPGTCGTVSRTGSTGEDGFELVVPAEVVALPFYKRKP
jgi:aminomethyltransferase